MVYLCPIEPMNSLIILGILLGLTLDQIKLNFIDMVPLQRYN